MTNTKSKKKIHAQGRDINDLGDLSPDVRQKKSEKDEKNRYGQILDDRKEQKRLRDKKKQEKPHIGKKGHIEKRAIAETQ